MSSFSIKNFFKNKSSVVTFNSSTNSFEIEDNAKSQVWFLNILMIFNSISMFSFYFRNENDGLSYFMLIFGNICIIVLILSFVRMSYRSHILLDEIKNVNYRKGTGVSMTIRLKNNRNRNLYLFQKEAAEVIVDLFQQHDVLIKEKSSWI